ncbi:MAG: polysaccharide deacetylase family protein, partial [Mycobacterium sp.]
MTRRARQRFPECDWCEDCDHHRCCRARPATTPVPRVTPAKLQVATSHHDFAEALGVRALVESGMTVGSHGWSHRDWRRIDDAQAREELNDAHRVL